MKKLQQLCLAAAFTLGLTTATFAGEIATGGRTEPPPPPSAQASATTSGEISTAQDDADYENQLIEDISVALLRTLLSAF
ncbi:MAG TPA: hypothetical protein VI306_08510 [Pyrinomonadaceae bacterium]